MAPQVQVNSSVTADQQVPDSEDQHVQGNADEETEDDEDLDRTVVNAIQPSTRSTPLLSASREVVQETPTVVRVKQVADSPARPSSIDDTPPEESHPEEPTEDSEGFPASAKRHPSVLIPVKRASPDADVESKGESGRSSKRVKPNGHGGSPAIQHPIRKTAAKPKKRLSDVQQEDATPTKSQRGSQRSSQRSSKDDGEEYNGPTPRVVFSNSAIPDSAKQAMKFLKANGAHVSSISDGCNILW
jgi:hypothetical protein